jgi:hypothetical protein
MRIRFSFSVDLDLGVVYFPHLIQACEAIVLLVIEIAVLIASGLGCRISLFSNPFLGRLRLGYLPTRLLFCVCSIPWRELALLCQY